MALSLQNKAYGNDFKPVKLYVHQGIALEMKGVAGLSTYTTSISVFIKIKKPEILRVDNNCQKVCSFPTLFSLAVKYCMRSEIGSGETVQRFQNVTNAETCMKNCQKHDNCGSFVYVPGYKDCALRRDYTVDHETRHYTAYEFDMKCIKDQTDPCNTIDSQPSSTLSDILSSSLEDRVETFWKNKKIQLKNLHLGNVTRAKRQATAIAMLSVPIIGSVLNFGYNWWESHKLNEKIDKMQQQFNEFTHKVFDFQKRTVQWEYEALNLIEKLDHKFANNIKEIQCETNILGYIILQSQEISEWERKVDEILRPLERGSKVGPLSPQIFDLTMLQNIISSVKDLANTVYMQDPSYLYHTTTATLIEINDNTADYSFHIILQVPVIKKNHAYPYYAVRQTSFSTKNRCYYHDLPEYVYFTNGNFIGLDMNLCEGGSGELLYCYQNLAYTKNADENKAKAACLNSELMSDCNIVPLKCTDKTVVLQTGVLIHTSSVIKAIYHTAINNTKIIEIHPNETSTRVSYYPWEKFETVEFQNGFVSNPDTDHAIELDIEITAPIPWTDMVTRNQIKIDKLNTTKALDILADSVDTINANTLIHRYFGWNKLYVTLTILSAAFWSLLLAYGTYQMITCRSSPKKYRYVTPRLKEPEEIQLKEIDMERAGTQNSLLLRPSTPPPDLSGPISTLTNVNLPANDNERSRSLKRRRPEDPHKTIADTSDSSDSN